jgi:hypothetical protein
MTQVVQAKCPHCKNTLRIPADWVHKAMRCKFCKQTFHSRQQPAPQNAAAVPVRRESADPFAFDDDTPGAAVSTLPRKRKKSKSGLVLALFGIVSLLGLSGAGFLWTKLPGHKNGSRAESGVAENGTSEKPAEKKGASGKKAPLAKAGPPQFPRRALLINVDNYLMFNSLAYGQSYDKVGKVPGSSTGALRERFIMTPPMNMAPDQVIELSDGARSPQPTQKAVIEATIKEFLEGCREQDRIILLFAGHACDIEKDSFLIPIEGIRDEPEKLIPLKWVYEQLAKCKARQKIFILDVFRYAPARGFELPGAGEGERGEMGEVFDANLLNPPPGVQVWSACVKGQASIELDSGSAFLQAFFRAMQDRGITSGIGKEGDPIPIEDLVVKTNKRLKELVTPEKQEQTSRLTGKEADGGGTYNPEEPVPPLLAIKPPPAPAGGMASHADVEQILAGIRLLPAVRETRAEEKNLLRAVNLPPFASKALAEFKASDYTIEEQRAQFKKSADDFAKKYPVRAAVFETVDALEETNKIKLIETLEGPSPLDLKRKAAFLDRQKEPAELIFKLEGALGQMKSVAEEREKETSKRWQANFDYALARLESRLVYLLEYNYLVAGIRADRLPDLEAGQSGWRVGTSKKIKINEAKAKALVKEIGKLYKKIEAEYPDTPWAILARRENLVALGLEWRAKSD